MHLRHIVMVLVGLGALACAYFLGRAQGPQAAAGGAADHIAATQVGDESADAKAASSGAVSATAPLPARDTSLKKVYRDLKARADAGDVAAATRLYRDLHICGYLDSVEWSFARVADELLDQKVDTTDAGKMEDYRVQLDAIESRKQAMQKFRSLCDGVDRTMLDSQLPSLQKAAQLGEEHARACYLARGPNYDPRGLMQHPEWLESYRANIKSMIDTGLAAGDWKVVDILRNAYQPGSDSMLSGVLGSDPILYYRYLKLYRLGAEPYRAEEIDRQLAAAATRIKPEQRADADLWAQSTFQQEFDDGNSTESTVPGWDPCSFPYDPL